IAEVMPRFFRISHRGLLPNTSLRSINECLFLELAQGDVFVRFVGPPSETYQNGIIRRIATVTNDGMSDGKNAFSPYQKVSQRAEHKRLLAGHQAIHKRHSRINVLCKIPICYPKATKHCNSFH